MLDGDSAQSPHSKILINLVRVLFINHTLQKSGAGISLATLLRHLPERVEKYFVLQKKSEIGGLLGAEEANVFRERFLPQFPTTQYNGAYSILLYAWHFAKALLAFWRVRQLARRWQPDVLHINETTMLAYVFAARAIGLPVVMHARTALEKRPLEMAIMRRIGGLRGVRIACIDGEVLESLPAECKPIARVVYNPIELGATPAASEVTAQRAEWGFGPQHFVIGQVASLHSVKGIWLILDLAEKLCTQHPQLRFVLAGDTAAQAGEGPQLLDAIRARGLTGKVILPGYVTNLANVYASLDVALCLFGGGLGGVGRAAYEAAVSGTALIATLPDPKNSATLEDGVTGLLFTQDDREGIAQAMEKLLSDPPFRQKLGAQAKEVIADRHAPTRIATQVMRLYTEASEDSILAP